MSEIRYFDAVLLYQNWAKAGIFDKYAGFIALNYDLALQNHGKQVSSSVFDEELGVGVMGKEHYNALYKDKEVFLVSNKPIRNDIIPSIIDTDIYEGLVTSNIESLEIPGSTMSVYVIGKVIIFANNKNETAVGYITLSGDTGSDVEAVPFITASARDWEICLNSFNYENVYDFIQKQTIDRVVEVS